MSNALSVLRARGIEEVIADITGLREGDVEDLRARYDRSPIISMADMPANEALLDEVRERVPDIFLRAQTALGEEKYLRFLGMLAETPKEQREIDEIHEYIAKGWDDLAKKIHSAEEQFKHPVMDGTSIWLKGMQLIGSDSDIARFAALYLLEYPIVLARASPQGEGRAGPKLPNLKPAKAVSLLSGLGADPRSIAESLWDEGIANAYAVAHCEVKEAERLTTLLKRYSTIMNQASRTQLQVEQPEVLSAFYDLAPERLPPDTFKVAIYEEMQRDYGIFGDSFVKGFAKAREWVAHLNNYLDHGDKRRLFKDLTGKEPGEDVEAEFRRRFISDQGAYFETLRTGDFDHGVPIHNLGEYIRETDAKLDILEDLREGLGEERYRSVGYADVENQLVNVRELLKQVYVFIDITIRGVATRKMLPEGIREQLATPDRQTDFLHGGGGFVLERSAPKKYLPG